MLGCTSKCRRDCACLPLRDGLFLSVPCADTQRDGLFLSVPCADTQRDGLLISLCALCRHPAGRSISLCALCRHPAGRSISLCALCRHPGSATPRPKDRRFLMSGFHATSANSSMELSSGLLPPSPHFRHKKGVFTDPKLMGEGLKPAR